MNTKFSTWFIAAAIAVTTATSPIHALAQTKASNVGAASALSMASVVIGASVVGSAAMESSVAILKTGGNLVVKTVESTARGTRYVLERASDGARVSVEIANKAVNSSAYAVGTVVVASAVSAGVMLSVAGEAIAFIPNALGLALLHNERLTN